MGESGPESLHVRDMDDIGFQRRSWRVQRVGWAVLALLILAAFLGVFGRGPISSRTVEASDDTVTVDYDRFIRNLGTASLTITAGEAATEGQTLTLRISHDLVTGWRIEDINPKPTIESGDADWLIWEFDLLGDGPPVVELHYRGDGLGHHAGAVRAGDGEAVHVSQWVYP